MTDTNMQVLFKSAPDGLPSADNFEIAHTSVLEPGEGEFLSENLYPSLAPYMQMLMGRIWTYG